MGPPPAERGAGAAPGDRGLDGPAASTWSPSSTLAPPPVRSRPPPRLPPHPPPFPPHSPISLLSLSHPTPTRGKGKKTPAQPRNAALDGRRGEQHVTVVPPTPSALPILSREVAPARSRPRWPRGRPRVSAPPAAGRVRRWAAPYAPTAARVKQKSEGGHIQVGRTYLEGNRALT